MIVAGAADFLNLKCGFDSRRGPSGRKSLSYARANLLGLTPQIFLCEFTIPNMNRALKSWAGIVQRVSDLLQRHLRPDQMIQKVNMRTVLPMIRICFAVTLIKEK